MMVQRPLVNGEIIAKLWTWLSRVLVRACVASMPVKDTIKAADAEGFSTSTPDPQYLMADPDTSNVYCFSLIYRAYEGICTWNRPQPYYG